MKDVMHIPDRIFSNVRYLTIKMSNFIFVANEVQFMDHDIGTIENLGAYAHSKIVVVLGLML